jgi:predicted dienelactone hydrolase
MTFTRRTLLAAGAGASLVVAGIGTAATATATPPGVPRLSLPEPTGRYPVGTRALHLVDRSRTDPLAPDTRHRELMVRLWYPAAGRHGPRAPYVSDGVAGFLTEALNTLTGTDYPAELLTFPTHSRERVPLARTRMPLVLFSPGLGTNLALYSSLLDELASRGYLVAGMDHTFETVVEFPGGRLEVPAEDLPSGEDVVERLLPIRLADTRFVLDRLASGFDPTAVAATGHSLGSITAVAAVDQDRRIDAGVALDGNPIGEASLDRPFLMMGNQHHRRVDDPDWAEFYDRLRGPRLHMVIDGTEHFDFGDVAIFKSTLDLDTIFEIGPIDGARALHIERTYLTAWLDFALRGKPSRLLRGESPDFPEVDFEGSGVTASATP